MIPFCLFQCNSNRMSAAAFGPAQAPSDACPARPRSPHGRRALTAPTRRCAVTNDTPLQMLHRHRRYAATDATPPPDDTPPSTLRRPDDTLPQMLHHPPTLHHPRRCAVPTIRCHRCYTTPPTLHRPRRCAVPTIRCHRCYTATNATPPQTLHRHRHCTAPDAAPPSTLSCPDATPPRHYALPPHPMTSHTQYDIDPMK